jgi:hypothetical protein
VDEWAAVISVQADYFDAEERRKQDLKKQEQRKLMDVI